MSPLRICTLKAATIQKLCLIGVLAACTLAFGQAASRDPQMPAEVRRPERPDAPNMVLLYYGFDARGPRNWTPDLLKHYLAYHENRGTESERPTDTFFDTVLWMYRRSSRGALFETSRSHTPTTRLDWEECLDRLFAEDLQLNALEQAAGRIERQLGRPVRVEVVLTLPYADVRVADWGDSIPGPTWDFRTGNDARFRAAKWYIDAALTRWQQSKFKHLNLLGFYWFNESHINLRPPSDGEEWNDIGLMRQVARHLHGLEVDGRALTLTWIPYSPYGKQRLNIVSELLQAGEAGDRLDYLMIQPNYFFPRHRKSRNNLVELVRAAESVPCGVEVECDESLVRDEQARQRLRDYLEVIAAEHDTFEQQPAGCYQGLRAVHEMATRHELADLYEVLYRFVAQRREAAAAASR